MMGVLTNPQNLGERLFLSTGNLALIRNLHGT